MSWLILQHFFATVLYYPLPSPLVYFNAPKGKRMSQKRRGYLTEYIVAHFGLLFRQSPIKSFSFDRFYLVASLAPKVLNCFSRLRLFGSTRESSRSNEPLGFVLGAREQHWRNCCDFYLIYSNFSEINFGIG